MKEPIIKTDKEMRQALLSVENLTLFKGVEAYGLAEQDEIIITAIAQRVSEIASAGRKEEFRRRSLLRAHANGEVTLIVDGKPIITFGEMTISYQDGKVVIIQPYTQPDYRERHDAAKG